MINGGIIVSIFDLFENQISMESNENREKFYQLVLKMSEAERVDELLEAVKDDAKLDALFKEFNL